MNDRFERLLKSRIGLDASSVGSAVIERAVRQRCNKVSGGNAEHYWMLLQGSAEEVQALIAPVAHYLETTATRVPFSDWYETVTGEYCQFMGRSVQGGIFMPVLMKKFGQ